MVFPSLAGALGGVRDRAARRRDGPRLQPLDPRLLLHRSEAPDRRRRSCRCRIRPAAVAEVEWAARHGFRCVMVRACRYQGRAHDHPDFAGFYAACAHARRGRRPAPVSLPRRRVEPGDPAGPGRDAVEPPRDGRHARAAARQHADHGLPDVRRRLRSPSGAQVLVHGEQRHVGRAVDRSLARALRARRTLA